MSVTALSLSQALKGPFVTLYGRPVLGLTIDSAKAELDGNALGLASIVAFRLGGLGCTHLPRALLIPLPGQGQPLEQAECGFQPGEVLKWNVSGNTSLVALTPAHGEASSLLPTLAAGTSHECECSGEQAAPGSSVGYADAYEFNACVSVTVNNGQVCLNVPVAGSVCIPVPASFPNGTAAQACIDLCKRFGIPCGAKVTVSVLGQVIATKGFGCC